MLRQVRDFVLSFCFVTWIVGLWTFLSWLIPLDALGQEASFTAPMSIPAGAIATIDYSASEGERFDFNVVPAVGPLSLVEGKVPGIVYFATATQGTYLLIVTAYAADGSWKLDTAIISVGGPASPIDPPAPSGDKYGVIAACSGHPVEKAADIRRFFQETGEKILAEGLKSTAIAEILKKSAAKWPDSWAADDGFYNQKLWPLIDKAALVKSEDWSRAYLDIAKGIKP